MSSSISYDPDEPGQIDPEAQSQFNHHTKMVTVDNWVEVILNASPEKIQNWSACLSYEKLLHPSTSIAKNLQEYCGSSWWTDHLIAWTVVVNAIISQSSKLIPDLPSFPLPLIFMRNDTGYRVPDVAITVSSAAVKTSKHNDDLSKDFDCWSQALGCVEFTSESNTQLEGMYDALMSRLSESGRVSSELHTQGLLYLIMSLRSLQKRPPISRLMASRLSSTYHNLRMAASARQVRS